MEKVEKGFEKAGLFLCRFFTSILAIIFIIVLTILKIIYDILLSLYRRITFAGKMTKKYVIEEYFLNEIKRKRKKKKYDEEKKKRRAKEKEYAFEGLCVDIDDDDKEMYEDDQPEEISIEPKDIIQED